MEISIVPRWLICLLSKNSIRQNDINILISNILIILIFLLFRNSLIGILDKIPHFCLFDKILGIQCPVCGTTRALCEIANGNLRNAYYLNLSSFFVATFFLIQILLRVYSLLHIKSTTKVNLISKHSGNILLVAIVINWIVSVTISH